MPYRTLTPRPPSKYGVWEDRSHRSFAVRTGLSPLRWSLRCDSFVEFSNPEFKTVHEACKRLELERVFAMAGEAFYIVDRRTGKCFSPPPSVLDDIIAKRCLICKAENGEHCDAGLHS